MATRRRPRQDLDAKVEGLDALRRDIVGAGRDLNRMDMRSIARTGARLAASYAPRRSGRLRRSIRPSTTKGKASIRAGGVRVPYAWVINYGWRKRNIEASHFMDRAAAVLRKRSPAELRREVIRIIRRKDLA